MSMRLRSIMSSRDGADARASFVALKLLPDSAAGDVVPLRLSFRSARGAIPIIPTAVAAQPDMGVIVHVLGEHRAIPLNYRHVVINEAAIDWSNFGSNYADVVAQAADEAGGHAFATDYAGPLDEALVMALRPLSPGTIIRLEEVVSYGGLWDVLGRRTLQDPDVQRVLLSVAEDQLALQDFLRCPDCSGGSERPIDGAAVAAALRVEVQEVREHLAGLFEASPYLTRLFTALSPVEMDTDPVFAFNPDLEDVPVLRTATRHVPCDGNDEDWENATIELADGRVIAADDDGRVVRRQDGEQVRGGTVPASSRVEGLTEAGPPVLLDPVDIPNPPRGRDGARQEREPGEMEADDLEAPDLVEGTGSGNDQGAGCDCAAVDPGPLAGWWLLALAGLRRRRGGLTE